jgi:hypothetical protein
MSVSFKPVSWNVMKLAAFGKRMLNLAPMAKEIETLIIQGNREGAMAGVDKNARAYAPLKPITVQTRRGDGPTLAPRGQTSRVVANFYCKATPSRGKLTVTAGWKGEDAEFLKYHQTGFVSRGGHKVPARNPNGIRPDTMVKIQNCIDRWFKFSAMSNIDIQSSDIA